MTPDVIATCSLPLGRHRPKSPPKGRHEETPRTRRVPLSSAQLVPPRCSFGSREASRDSCVPRRSRRPPCPKRRPPTSEVRHEGFAETADVPFFFAPRRASWPTPKRTGRSWCLWHKARLGVLLGANDLVDEMEREGLKLNMPIPGIFIVSTQLASLGRWKWTTSASLPEPCCCCSRNGAGLDGWPSWRW